MAALRTEFYADAIPAEHSTVSLLRQRGPGGGEVFESVHVVPLAQLMAEQTNYARLQHSPLG
jgi:hypothetical protein